MSENTNPYEPIQTERTEQESNELPITDDMISSIKKSSAWIRFIAIYGFICAGLFLAMGILFANLFVFVGFMDGDMIAAEIGLNPFLLGIMITIFIVALGIAIIIPLRFLYIFGSQMRTYAQTNNESALEIAFKNNTSFWKFCGILTIIAFLIIPVSLIIMGVFYV
jgi:hypothetical protein